LKSESIFLVYYLFSKKRKKREIFLMGFVGDESQEGSGSNYVGQGSSCSWRFLTRRKKVDNSYVENSNNSHHGVQLAKELTIPHLMAIGNSIFNLLKFLSFETCFSSW